MSERGPKGAQEHLRTPDSKELQQHQERIGEKLKHEAEQARSGERVGEKLEQARKSAEKHAVSGKEAAPTGSERQRAGHHTIRAHKKQTYRATMKRVEAQLPAYQRTFSRVINNPTVDTVSALTAKTVARPSGILGASFFAFVGLLTVSYFARRIGFELSGTEFIFLLIAGWFVGLITEALWRMFHPARR